MKPFDFGIAAVLAVVAAVYAAWYSGAARHAVSRPDTPGFDQRVYGAALMSVCGRGLITPIEPLVVEPQTPAAERPLIEFLALRREAITCDQIPAQVPTNGLDGMQQASRYLILLAQAAWKVTGPKLAGLDALVGLLFGLTIGLAYVTARLVMWRPIAAGLAILLIVSPRHLINLTNVRDYAKAPFFTGAVCSVCFLVTRAARPRTVVLLAAATGAFLGFGFGVRTDVVLNMALVVAAIAWFLPGPVRQTLKLRAGAVAACLIAFTIVSWPMFRSQASGSNLWHWALLGYGHDFDDWLDVSSAPYELGYFYDDSYIATVVDAYWGRTTHKAIEVSVGVPEYTPASRSYYLSMLSTFPADALIRGWAAVIKILNLPFTRVLYTIPDDIVPLWMTRVFALRERLLALLAGVGVPLCVAVVLMVGSRNLKLAILIIGVIAFVGAYPAVQYQRRHIFHLEFVSLFLLGLMLSFAAAWIWNRVVAEPAASSSFVPARSIARPLALLAGAIGVFVVAPLVVSRVYQQRSATDLLTRYVTAPVETIPLTPRQTDEDTVRLANGSLWLPNRPDRSMASDMLVAEISGERCGVDRVTLRFSTVSTASRSDFSRTFDVEVPKNGESARVFFPVYTTAGANPHPEGVTFDGVDLSTKTLPCLKHLSRFTEPEPFGLLLPVVLPPGWKSLPLHQALRNGILDKRS